MENGNSKQASSKINIFSKIPPDQRKFKCLIGSEIIIEGLIGVGKSTLGKSVTSYLEKIGLPVRFFNEFLNIKLLKLYINDMKHYGYAFQIIMMRERLRIYKEAKEFSKKGGISIIDRSLIGDYAFALMLKNKGYINDAEWEVYLDLMKYESDDEPNITVFLQCTPEQAFERMKNRSLQVEKDGYSLNYFKDLDAAYQNVINKISHNIAIVPWGDNCYITNDYLSDKDCKKFLEIVRTILIS